MNYPEYDKEIIGLCPNKCSCDVCRAARKADKGYQRYLTKKWCYEREIENRRTLENARAHDQAAGSKKWRGHEKAVNLFQGKN
jgi:hypothetical protein